jgi:hypothetical protein
MVVTFTDDIDLTARGKRVASVNIVTSVATTVNIRRGSLTGPIVWQIVFAAAGLAQFHFSWSQPIYVAEGVFVECTAALAHGAIDLI